MFFTVQHFETGEPIPVGSRYLFSERGPAKPPTPTKPPPQRNFNVDLDAAPGIPEPRYPTPPAVHWHFYEVPLRDKATTPNARDT